MTEKNWLAFKDNPRLITYSIIMAFSLFLAFFIQKTFFALAPTPPPVVDYYVYDKDDQNGDTLYLIKNMPEDNTVENGFACLCKNSGGKHWMGSGDDACSPGAQDKRISLTNPLVRKEKRQNVTPPSRACCRNLPNVAGRTVLNLPDCS